MFSNCDRSPDDTSMTVPRWNDQLLALHVILSLFPHSLSPDEDESDLPLLKLTEEDMQIMTESLQDAKIDNNQLELTETLGEGEGCL